MSFGASPSDIIIVVTFCKALYRKCRDAGGEYDEISREVRGLHTVLRHLKYEVEAPESPLNRDNSIWGRQLAPIIGDCDFTLRQLDGLIQKYGRLSAGSGSPSSPRVLWDKVRFGSNEMDQLGGIRVKLISHKTSLTLFLDTIQLHQSGKMATTLNNHGGQLDVILDKVDNIAAKIGQRSGSLMTSYDDDDKEVWKQFRRELVAEGFSSDVLQQHKDVLRAYIREIDQKGLLDEMPPDPHIPPTTGVNAERWLEDIQSVPSEGAPPSFNSLNTGTDDSGAKEMVIREDNMKFPQSMKLERPKPETRRDGDTQRQLEVPVQAQPEGRIRSDSPGQASLVPKLITSDEKEVQYYNTDGSSDEDSEGEYSWKRPRSPSKGLIIRTSDLTSSSQALQIHSSSPTSFRSSQGSFADEDVTRSMAHRPKQQPVYGSSPLQPGAVPIPVPNSKDPNDRNGTSPRPELLKLAPDSQGNEIPPDAKWTRINRRLVSPEVLSQDGRRFEARPDFVAVLGVLSRMEIEDYAARTHELRESRHNRNQKLQQSQPPPQPPRPMQRAPERPRGRDTPSEDSDSESSGSEHRHRRPRYKEHRTYPGSDAGHQSGYPNPFGVQPPLSPMWSPTPSMTQPVWMSQRPPNQPGQGGIWIPTSPQPGQMYYPSKDRDIETPRRHSSPPKHLSRSSHSKHKTAGLKSDDHKEKSRSRWKENLTAAGIGGAAVSLLNVLSEAAEAL